MSWLSFKEARSVSKLDRERDWSFVDLADRCSDLNDVLSEVDDVAFARIARASPTYVDQLLPETIVNLELLKAALRITTSPKVPRKKHHEHNNFLTVALADVYESVLKKYASVTTDPITDKRKGPFVDFVVCFAEHFLPDESLDLNGRTIQRALKTRRDNPDLAEIYRTKIENLSSLLDDPECKTEAFDTIRGLIDEVRLVPEKGNLSVELKGELAGILSLCDTKQKHATSYEERAEQIKMVAGARKPRESLIVPIGL